MGVGGEPAAVAPGEDDRAAAGAVEVVTIFKAMQTGMLHATINLNDPDPECDLDYVPNQARACRVNHALSNSFGFGGHNVTIAVGSVNNAG